MAYLPKHTPDIFCMASRLSHAQRLQEDTEPKYVMIDSFQMDESLTEAAMKAKERNALGNSEFGLPRLRKYPLNDRKHVAQAIRMFGHVKIEADRKTLATAIVKKYDEFKMTTRVGKNNPLYKYVPDRMRLVSVNENPAITVYGFEKPTEQRSEKDIAIEHLQMNDALYNNLFFNNDYSNAIKQMNNRHMEYLEYFYPSFKTHNFVTRTRTSIGGLYASLKSEAPEYRDHVLTDPDEFDAYCNIHYNYQSNWYKTEKVDTTHIRWCLRLYDIIQTILNKKVAPDTNDVSRIMLEWLTSIEYHYGVMKESVKYSNEYFEHCQYLHDMFWDPLDNPEDTSICGANIISFVMAIYPDSTGNVNESGELIKKQDVLGYMSKELKMDDDIYLLPAMMQYPVIDATTVRIAMDNIRKIDEEDIDEYTKNLNRKYQELNCRFQISADHPYAKYATADMKCIEHVLMESNGDPNDDTLPREYQIAKNLYYNNESIYYI